MICQKCGRQTEVIESRPRYNGDVVRRRRFCKSCGNVFTTLEMTPETYKILLGGTDIVEEITDEIEKTLWVLEQKLSSFKKMSKTAKVLGRTNADRTGL